ncbi:hypothetical protein OH76DRAFT_1413368 [Lentinus brumalis]|uniref:Uncharacterized protein n=1 Tax=Lentinus brumalis TaxID=2498619 RepID=A0A371CHK7_9APHY|nr:hypothetical protein OH76DRAFT_1413368 [Polyporus brumalis]
MPALWSPGLELVLYCSSADARRRKRRAIEPPDDVESEAVSLSAECLRPSPDGRRRRAHVRYSTEHELGSSRLQLRPSSQLQCSPSTFTLARRSQTVDPAG